MAKSTKSKVTTKPAVDEKSSIVVQQLYISQLNRGNQTIQTWINNIKAAESVLNPNRKALLNTYLDISIDLHTKSVIDKRARAVMTQPFEWVGLKGDAYIENFQSPWFHELLGFIMKRRFWGTVVVEFKLGPDGLICGIDEIPPQNVKPNKALISFDGSSDNGIVYTDAPYVNYLLQIGKANELGLLSNIAPYVLMKRQNLSDFSRFNEMFGMPLRWYEYDPLDPTARDNVKKSAEEMGSCAYVIVPKGTTVNFVESTKQATAYTYDKFHEIMNNEITIGVLGQLLTTGGEDGGSYSLGQVHKAVEEGINLEDRLVAEYILNYQFKNNILIPHGYPMDGVKGQFKMTEQLSKEVKAKIFLELIAPKFPIDPKFIYEEFGIPEPTPEAIAQWKEYIAASKPQPPIDANNPEGGQAKDEKKPEALAFKEGSVSLDVRKIYNEARLHGGHQRPFKHSLSLSYNSDLNDAIEDLVKKIWNRELAAGDVDPQLWEVVSNELSRGVEVGYKLAKGKGIEQGMLEALERDVQVFSGFKNYQMLREATDLLVDETGAMRSFADFRTEVLKLNNEYNVTFLEAEYNQAVASSRMSGKWQQIVKNKETLPLLEYLTAGDSRVRASHRKLNNIILPMDHPFWDTYMPPNDWNCRCNVRQLADGEISVIKDDQLPPLKDEFKFNPGKQRVVFPKSHPYYKVASKDQGSADNNFGLPISK